MKRIVVCCDGTWSKPGSLDRGQLVETNVEKIYNALSDEGGGIQQIRFYGQGLGTGFALTDHLFGGSFGIGIDNNIQDAYKFLMWSYEPGDEIYLFGFSRGAYTVRSLVGLIRNCGILQAHYLHLVNEAYHLYRDRSELTHPESDLTKAFRKSYAKEPDTPIKFLGVWDTVGSLGIPVSFLSWWNRRYHFHDVKLSSGIKYAYHALAVDEKRKYFRPALWEVSKDALEREDPQVSEQVWFPGVHCNVGGGYADSGLSDICLKWMADKARSTGLRFNDQFLQALEGNSRGELRNSAVGVFRLTPKMQRVINNAMIHRKEDAKGRMTTGARIRNEKIHYSCLERSYFISTYRPKNLRPALERDTALDPVKDQWQPQWEDYLRTLAPPKAVK
jgi:uncharacterized protein (DUF2235 family)